VNLSLAQKDGLNILTVTGPMDIRNLQILKAGITKLFKDGKNRIILEIKSEGKLESDVIRELAVLDLFAKELAGSIAVVCGDAELKQSLMSFAKPPVMSIFSEIAQAVEYFAKGAATAVEPEEIDPEALKGALAAKDRELEALRNQVKVLDPAEITKLRADNVELQTKIREFEEQVKNLLLERRIPPDADAYKHKIDSMKSVIEELTAKMAAPAPKKAAEPKPEPKKE
jgi:hypothetical protein